MENPFFEREWFVSPSMNRVRIMDLPGVDVPDAVRGRTGFELLSATALTARVREKTIVLGLPDDVADVLRAFDGCFTSASPTIRAAARAIGREYGRKLACLLLTLKRGDDVNRTARPDWDERHWQFWADIEQVIVGGGLVAGHLGNTAVSHAETILHTEGLSGFTLGLSPWGAALPLVGIARLAPRQARGMLLFDFGHTSVKRACAFYEEGVLTTLQQLSPVPSECDAEFPYRSRIGERPLLDWMLALMDETWKTTVNRGWSPVETMAVSVACYLQNGQPTDDWGCYGCLGNLAPHLPTLMTAELRTRLNLPVHIHLVHDGTAAAMPYADQRKTAVLTLGTAIGIGFPPTYADFRTISKSFAIC